MATRANITGGMLALAAALLSPVTHAQGPGLYALDFNGDDYVDCGSSGDLNLTIDATLEAWANFASTANYQTFFSKDEGPGTFSKYCFWYVNGATCVHINGSFGNNWYYSNPWTPVPGQWYHVAVVKQGATFTFYLNGVQNGVVSGPVYEPVANCPFRIGEAEGGNYFQGQLDEVRVWSVVRSGQEIHDAMYVPLTGTETGLVGYWRMEEGVGQMTADATGHGHTGQLGSSPDPDDRDPAWVEIALSDAATRTTADGSRCAIFPNPFSTRANIVLYPSQDAELRLEIFDVNGALLVKYASSGARNQPAVFTWSGTDEAGRAVPQGTYFVRVAVAGEEVRRKVTVLR